MALSIKQKKEWAKLLYLRENITQKDICEKVDISQRTLSLWVNKEKWSKMKNSIILTKSEELTRLYNQLREMNDFIESKDQGKRFPSKAEADTLTSLKTAIKAFENEASITTIVDVSIKLIEWLRPIDFEKSKEISNIFDQFIKYQLNDKR